MVAGRSNNRPSCNPFSGVKPTNELQPGTGRYPGRIRGGTVHGGVGIDISATLLAEHLEAIKHASRMDRLDRGAISGRCFNPPDCLSEVCCDDPTPKRIESRRSFGMVGTGIVKPAQIIGGKK